MRIVREIAQGIRYAYASVLVIVAEGQLSEMDKQYKHWDGLPSRVAFAHMQCAEAYARLPAAQVRGSIERERIRAHASAALCLDEQVRDHEGERYWRVRMRLHRRAAMLLMSYAVSPQDTARAHSYLVEAKRAEAQDPHPREKEAIRELELAWRHA
jgi:hypothetical protein